MPEYFSVVCRADGQKKDFILKKEDHADLQEVGDLSQWSPKTVLTAQNLPKAPLSQEESNHREALSIQKIELPTLPRPVLQRHSFSFFWKELILSIPSCIPVFNILWILVISPIMAMLSFLRQDTKLQGEWESYLGRLQLSSYSHYITALGDFASLGKDKATDPIWESLTTAVERGRQILSSQSIDDLSHTTNQWVTQWGENEDPQTPLLLPAGIDTENGFIPLFLVCTKAGDRFCLDVNTWGGTPVAPLEATYYYSSLDSLQEGLYGCLLATIPPSREGQSALNGLNNKIAFHNLNIWTKTIAENDTRLEDMPPCTTAKRLHERLLLTGGQPLQPRLANAAPQPHGKRLSSFIERALLEVYPEFQTPAKIMVFLSLCREGIAIFKETAGSLSPLEHQKGFALLQSELQRVHRHVNKFFTDPEEKAAFQQTFQAIQEEFAALETLSFKGSYSPTISETPVRILNFKPHTIHESEPHNELPAIDCSAELSVLKDSFFVIQTHTAYIKTCNDRIDALIAMKHYAAARALSLELMRVFQVPIYSGLPQRGLDENVLNSCSEEFARIVKGFWESSLRLNLSTVEAPEVVQIVKMQIFIFHLLRISDSRWNRLSLLGQMPALDIGEIDGLISSHPHLRSGIYPQDEQEWLLIHQYLREHRAYIREHRAEKPTLGRRDTIIGNNDACYAHEKGTSLEDTPSFQPIRRTPNTEPTIADQIIDFRRVQMMMTCLLNPDYCLARHVPAGSLGRLAGVKELEDLYNLAKKESPTPSDIPQNVLRIKWRDVMTEMSSYTRLELSVANYVSEHPIITIVNDGAPVGNGIAYLPNGFGLPRQLEKNYALQRSEANSKALAGMPEVPKEFLTYRDQDRIIPWDARLSPASGNTELTHLTQKLQEEPTVAVNQMQNYLLSIAKVVHGQEPLPSGVIEALLFLLREPHLLLTPSVRQALELILSSSFAMQRTLRANSLFFVGYGTELTKLIHTHQADEALLCQLLHLSNILYVHLDAAIRTVEDRTRPDPYLMFGAASGEGSAHLQQAKESFPQWGLDQLLQKMQTPDAHIGAWSFLIIERLRSRTEEPIDIPPKDLSAILRAAFTYPREATTFQMAQFTAQGVEWIERQLKPLLKEQFLALPLNNQNQVLNDLIALWDINTSMPKEWLHENWVEHQGVFRKGPFCFDVHHLQLESTDPRFNLLQSAIPKQIASLPEIQTLFGTNTLYATHERGSDASESIYTLTYKQYPYRIVHHTEQRTVTIFKEINGMWTQWVHGANAIHPTTTATISQLMTKNGLWIDASGRRGWIFTHLPKDTQQGRLLSCSVTADGTVTSIRDHDSGQWLVTGHQNGNNFQDSAPFWPEHQVLAFAPRVGQAASMIYEPLTGDLLQGHELTTQAFAQPMRLVSSIPIDSEMGKFLHTLGPLGSSVALPLSDASGHQTLLLKPYVIRREKGSLFLPTIDARGEAYTAMPTSFPLSLRWTTSGNIEGSPSAFLYLAYIYAHKKDYVRAYVYLEKARKTARISQEELPALRWVAKLLLEIPTHSLRGSRYALQAALTIHAIRRTDFAETLYTQELSSEHFDEIQAITNIYRTYQRKVEERGIQSSLEEEIEALSQEDIASLDTLEKISLREFSDAYDSKRHEQEKLLPSSRKIRPQELTHITTILETAPRFSVKELKALVAFTNMQNIDHPLPFNQIPHGSAPSPEVLVLYFFDFVHATQNPEDKTKLIHYLLSQPTWENTSLPTPQEKELAQLGNSLRAFLLSLTLSNIQTVDFLKDARIQIQEIRAQLPKLPRPQTGVVSAILYLYTIDFARAMQEQMQRVVHTWHQQIVRNPSYYHLFEANVQMLGANETQYKPTPGHLTTPEVMQKVASESPYSDVEATVLRELFNSAKIKNPQKEGNLFEMMQSLQNNGYPIMGMRVLNEHLQKIQTLEKQLTDLNQSPPPQAQMLQPHEWPPLKQLQRLIPQENSNNPLNEAQTRLQRHGEQALSYFQPQNLAIENQENAQLRSGIEQGIQELSQELRTKHIFSPQESDQLKRRLQEITDWIGGNLQNKRTEILSLLNTTSIQEFPPSLRKMIRFPDLYSEETRLEELMHIYKKGPLLPKNIDRAMTSFLFFKTAHQQLSKTDGASIDDSLSLLKALCVPERYQADLLSRKCLVAEALNAIILRPQQRQALREMAENPKHWSSVRMGIGKTSYIMPIIADLLSEKGYLPVLTVPHRLLARNRDSLDTSTRKFFDQAAVEFTMSAQKNLSPAQLCEKYFHLLTVKKSGGYIITSPEHLASLNEQIILHQKELFGYIPPLSPNPTPDDRAKIVLLQLKIHFLQKIAQLIYGESSVGESFFFGDEVDDTHHISNQINLAIGEKIPIQPAIREAVEAFFITLAQSKDPNLLVLQTALEQGGQAGMLAEDRTQALKTLAIEIKSSSYLNQKLSSKHYTLIKNTPNDQWCAYLLNQSDELPTGWPLMQPESPDLSFFETLGTLKIIFGTNAQQLLSLQPGNDLGLSNHSGFIVVPKQLKNEIQGMRHGNEYELVFAQYLGYYQMAHSLGTTDATRDFLHEELKKMKYEDAQVYQELASLAQTKISSQLIDYLLKPEAWPYRFHILRRVFEQNYISRYSQQVEMSVQDLYQGAQFGGVSGTLDPYMLPYISDQELFREKASSSTRQVEAETMIRFSMGHADGLDTEIVPGQGIYQDSQASAYLLQRIQDRDTKAIVNASGVTAEGKDTLQWIRELRQTPEGETRSYLFIHPTAQIPYLWLKNQTLPTPLGTRTLPDDAICIYAPSDTRGTDLPIGPGNVHLFLGPATSLQDMMQAIYRARQLGSTQTVYLHISEQMASLMTSVQKTPGKTTLGDIFNYIKIRTLQTKSMLNLKAAEKRITGRLKGAVLKYQRSTLELENLIPIIARQNAFPHLEKFLIKDKHTNLALAYPPRNKGNGIERIEAAFSSTKQQIKALQQEIGSMPSTTHHEEVLLASLDSVWDELVHQEHVLQSTKEQHQAFLPSCVDLLTHEDASTEGDQEQVIALEQEQALTQTLDIEETLESRNMTHKGKIAPNNHEAIRLDYQFNLINTNNRSSREPFVLKRNISAGEENGVYYSPEADKISNRIPYFTKTPLFYIAVSTSLQEVCLITHFDYHRLYIPNSGGPDASFSGQIYAVMPNGLLSIHTPSKKNNDPKYSDYSDDLKFKVLLARFYMCDVSFNREDYILFHDRYARLPFWIQQNLQSFTDKKGHHAMKDFVQSLPKAARYNTESVFETKE